MYSRDTACRVRFTVSGCVSCGGWFGWRTVEDAGPYGDVIPSETRNLKILHCVQNDN